MTPTLNLRPRSAFALFILCLLCVPTVPFLISQGCPKLQAKPAPQVAPVETPPLEDHEAEPTTNQCGCGGWIAQLCPACYSQTACAVPSDVLLNPSAASSPNGVDDNCMCYPLNTIPTHDEEVILFGKWTNVDGPDYTQPDWPSFDHPTFYITHWWRSLSASNNDFAGPRNDLFDAPVSVVVRVKYIDGSTDEFDVSTERSCVYDITPVHPAFPKAQLSYWQTTLSLPQPAALISLFTDITTLEGECLIGDWKVYVTN